MRAGNSARASLPEADVLVAEPPPLIEQDGFLNDVAEPSSNGATEPRANADLEVPFEAQFGGKDYLPAPGLRRVALSLIMRDQALRHLTDVHVEYLWKRRGGQSRGVPKIGDCVMPSGLSKHAWNQMAQARSGSATERVVFVVWLASDHLETFSQMQVEASLYRQLLKTTTDERDHSAFKLRAPDFGGFIREIERYGLWNQSLVQAAPAFSQARGAAATTEGDPWGMETTLNHAPVETTGEGQDA